MNDKIVPDVRTVLDEIPGDTYIRVRVVLAGAHFTQEARGKLHDWMCTHLVQTARMASVEIPRKFVEELADLEEVQQVREVIAVY